MDKGKLEALFHQRGFSNYRWIRAEQIQVAQWVRFKCMFGCSSYGKKGTCPPQVPSVEECREFFNDYDEAVIFHLPKAVERPEDRSAWSREVSHRLIDLEREVFWSGYHKAFMLFMDECRLCDQCAGSREGCVKKEDARPGPESLAVDVFATARSAGYPIEVLRHYHETMNRYAILLVS